MAAAGDCAIGGRHRLSTMTRRCGRIGVDDHTAAEGPRRPRGRPPEPSDETDAMPPLHHDGRLRLAAMPKVELHVHLEGSIRPETLMALSAKNGVDLPPKTLDEFREWFRFVDFPHFAEVYQAMSKCIRTPEDLETITRDFLAGQAAQNILHSEATFTALTHYRNAGIPFDEQIDAIDRAREWAKKRHGVSLLLIVDIPREFATPQEAMMTAGWVADAHGKGGVAALGLEHPASRGTQIRCSILLN